LRQYARFFFFQASCPFDRGGSFFHDATKWTSSVGFFRVAAYIARQERIIAVFFSFMPHWRARIAFFPQASVGMIAFPLLLLIEKG